MRFESGALRATFDDSGAFLREVAVAGEEVFRGIGFVVRDANWGTPSLVGSASLVEQDGKVRLESAGDLQTASGDLAWKIAWTLADNVIEARAEWSSHAGYSTNRTGFVVLHSLRASRGRAVRVTHPDGQVERSAFPELISPDQPFFDIAEMAYETAGGAQVKLIFEGEIFEIEDQRNWSDASYKTYCRPLRLPFPYRVEPGARRVQSVRVEIAPPPTSFVSARQACPSIGPAAALPAIGTSLAPGRLPDAARRAVAELGLNFTAIELDLSNPSALDDFEAKLACAGRQARIDIRPAAREAIVDALRRMERNGRDLLGITLWGADDRLIDEARRLAGAPIGSGSPANFAELNRMEPWPLSADYLSFASNPTVHGSSDDTLGETTETPDDILATIRSRAPERPLHIGPLTLAMRFNAVATTPEGRAGAQPDPRQQEEIAAAWAVSTLAGYVSANVRALAFFEPFGPKGLISAEGALTPAGHVLSRLASYRGLATRPVRWPDAPRARGLFFEEGDRAALCIAYPRDEPANLELPDGEWRIEKLGASGFGPAEPSARRSLEAGPFSVHWLRRAT
jgi:hypothetical protein